MTEEKKILKVEFAPGAFDGFEGTQEELDEFINEIKNMFEGKTKEELESIGRPLTEEDFDEMDDDDRERLVRAFGKGNDRTLQ